MASPKTVRIPRQRGRGRQPYIVVVPEHRHSLTGRAASALALLVWDHRRALAPTGLALLAFGLTTVLHTLAWWAALVLAPAALAPLVWFAIVQRRHPADASALAWRITLAAVSALAGGWVALAVAAGPLAGPLEVWWLLLLLGTQTAWFIVRRTH
ncbi:hypothetical protein QFZ75_006084 [Streptomyces sp. V3I8]|uniref:hypothetical protein n=1 Tax=Streptomyces sp. V3I8 TaxID=3042279 RepID=UPI002789CEC3|nr:hypothetical protein [Streptomyces sp. V3I8]MDQ1039668.1 hypothetical protein [Streptomyces sp. V3I8]